MFRLAQRSSVRAFSASRIGLLAKYPPPPAHFGTKRKYFGKLVLATFVTGCVISYNYSIFELTEMYLNVPETDNEAASALYTMNLEDQLQTLPIVQKLKDDPRYTHFRSWDQLKEATAGLSDFQGTLSVPGGIALPPFHFHCQETGDDVVVLHVGKRLSGYPMIVHGGMLGMLVDEVFKRNVNSEFAIPVNDIHTTNLKIDYKFPCFVNQFIVIKSNAHRGENGLYEVTGDVSTVSGRLLLQGSTKFKSSVKPVGGGPEKTGWLW